MNTNTKQKIEFILTPTVVAGWPFPTGAKPAAMTAGEKSPNNFAETIKLVNSEQLEKAKLLNVGIVHIKDSYNPKGGLTIAFRKCSRFKSGRMVDVAVNVCSIEDTFSRKLGTQGALAKFFNNETVQLPLLNSYMEEDLNWVVKNAFTAFIQEI